MKKKIKVLIVEHSMPFYHLPAWEALGSKDEIELTVAYGQGFFTGKVNGVPEADLSGSNSFKSLKCNIVYKLPGFQFLWHSAALKLLFKNQYDVVIHQFELKMVSLIPILLICKLKGVKFALWGIGNPLKPSPIMDVFRKSLVKSTDAIIFYSETNKTKYLNFGISEKKMFVAKNSINIEEIIEKEKQTSSQEVSDFKASKGLAWPTVLTVGRLIERKRIDLLILAAPELKRTFPEIKIVIVGNGPELKSLQKLTDDLAVNSSIIFTGKLEGLQQMAPWYLASDLIVAPAQIGHLASEAHAYGKPLLISSRRDLQGPESEILIPGVTGQIYDHGSVDSLVSNSVQLIQEYKKQPEQFKLDCQKRATEFCGTGVMANGFLGAILSLTNSIKQK